MDVTRKLTPVVLTILIVATFVPILVRAKHPVLIRMPFGLNQETGDHNYVLFNPFRDRSPERAAAEYLEAMRRGDCADVAWAKNGDVWIPEKAPRFA